MDFGFTKEELAFREEVEDFTKKELPPGWDDEVIYWPGSYGTQAEMEAEYLDVTKRFLRKLGSKGWLSLAWPREQQNQAAGQKPDISGNS